MHRTTAFLLLVAAVCLPAAALAIEAPANPYATPGDGVAELYWDAAPGATGYRIYRSDQPGTGYSQVAEVSQLWFLDTGLANGRPYYYVVTALDGAVESAYSAEVAVAPVKTFNALTYTRQSDEFYFFNPWMIDSTYGLSGADGERELLLIEGPDAVPGTGSRLRLTADATSSDATSADGCAMVFIADNMIQRLDLASNQITVLKAQNVFDGGLAVSPATGEIAYIYDDGGQHDLHIIDADGGNDRVVLDDTYDNRWPEFAPDGSHLVFVTDRPGDDEVYRIDPDGSGLTRLTNNTLDEERPAYAPDGSLIAFSAYTSAAQKDEVYTVTSSGGSLTKQSGSTNQDELAPAFSPNGEWLAWIWVDRVWNPTYGLWEDRHHIQRKRLSDGALAVITDGSCYVRRNALAWAGKTDGMAPKRVAGLAAVSPTSESVVLEWTAPGDDGRTGVAASYDIRFSTAPLDETTWAQAWRAQHALVPQPSGAAEGLVVSVLQADTTYFFAIKAVDEQGNVAALSNVATATTMPSADSTPPDAPPWITVTPTDYLRNVVTWGASVSSDVAMYWVLANGFPVGETNETTFTHTLAVVATVTYSVIAFDENGNQLGLSPQQPATSKDDTVPAPPAELRAFNTTDRVLLIWQPSTEPDADHYEIWRKPDGGAWGHLDDVAGQTRYEDTSGTPEQKYFYAVKAVDTAGNASAMTAGVEGIKGWPDNERVLIVVNANSADSVEIGQYYKQARNVPDEHVVTVSTSTGTFVFEASYYTQVQDVVRDAIVSQGLEDKILYVVTTRGVPLMVLKTDTGAVRALDSMLADVYETVTPGWGDDSGNENPYYLDEARFAPSHGTLLVSRLSGPSVEYVKGMIDRALYAERHLDVDWGKAWIDLRDRLPSLSDGLYAQAERYIETAGLKTAEHGVETIVDRNAAMFPNGTCDNTLFYYGWYSFHNFQPIFDGYLKVGSVAWHLDSLSAYILTDPADPNWSVQMIMRGATITAGSVREPYASAMQAGGIFYERFFRGYTAAESWWASIPNTHWMMVLVGDPLYSPFREPAVPDAEAPVISSIGVEPTVAHHVRITWETDEVAEHRVEYGPGYASATAYDDWHTRRALVELDGLDHNTPYAYRVLSRDPAGNERVLDAGTLTIPDDDNDGLPNGVETGTGVYVSEEDTGTRADDADSDDDGLLDGDEVYARGTDPNDPDCDDDGLLDGVETDTGTYVDETDTGSDPNDPDSDDDGLTDGDEVLVYGTDPNKPGDITDVYWDQIATSVVVTFASEEGVDYVLERADADAYADGLTWYSLPGDTLVGAAGEDTFTDDVSANPLPNAFRFYRVKRADGTNTSRQTAGVFEMPIDAAATTLYFISTPLIPDPDHNSVAAVFGEGAGRQIVRSNFTVSDLDESNGAISRMRNASGTYSVLAGSAFDIVPGVGYEVYVGLGFVTDFKLRLTGYVPETSITVPLTKENNQAVRWMGYSLPRTIKLSELGLPAAVTPLWSPTNKVRLLPPASPGWFNYVYDTGTSTWLPSDPDLEPGMGIVFIRAGFNNLTDDLELTKWYVSPPNMW